jgi:hypothetical protein
LVPRHSGRHHPHPLDVPCSVGDYGVGGVILRNALLTFRNSITLIFNIF